MSSSVTSNGSGLPGYVRVFVTALTAMSVGFGSVLVAANPVAAADQAGGFEYSLVQGGAQLEGCADDECPTELEIPVTLEVNDQLVPVVAIANEAFDLEDLVAVNFAKGSQLKTIGDWAFAYNGIEDLEVPASVKKIGDHAFYDSALADLSIEDTPDSPSQLGSIGGSAFASNNILSLRVPLNVTTIGDFAFSGNDQLNNVRFYGDKPEFGSGSFDGTGNRPYFRRAVAANWEGTVSLGEHKVSAVPDLIINSQPVGGQLPSAGHVDLAVGVDTDVQGQGSVSYQWFKGAEAIDGATSSTYKATALGKYRVRLTSWTGSIVSAWAVVSTPQAQFTYTDLGGGTARLDGCVGSCPKVLEIPAKADGLTVVSIANNAFSSKGLTVVGFEDGSELKRIGKYAFAANNLKSVDLPSSVTTIDDSAFEGNDLTSVVIPSNVTTIGNSAFISNDLISVTLPSSVTTISTNAFRFNKISSLVVPASVTTIGTNAFSDNVLESLSIDDAPGNPSKLESIDSHAFRGNRLDDVSIPASVKSIGQQAFDVNGITNLSLASNGALADIDEAAFRGNSLEAVEIPSSVTQVGSEAFASNENLESVVFRGGQPTFGYDVFAETKNDPIIVRQQGVSPSWSLSTVGGRSISKLSSPQILSQPVGGSLESNGSMNLAATVATDIPGQGELTYQWRRDGVEIENANTSTYQATTPGLYRLAVSSWAGETWSTLVTVTESTPSPAQAVPALVAQKHQSVKVKLPKRLKRNKVYKLPAKTRQGVAISYKVKGAGKCKINKKKRTITCKRTTAKKKFRLLGAAKATTTLYVYKITVKRRVK